MLLASYSPFRQFAICTYLLFRCTTCHGDV